MSGAPSTNTPDSKFPYQRERWKIRLVTFAVMLLVLWVFVWGSLSWQPKPAWTKNEGGLPDESWFRYVMFPRNASVDLFDAPDGKPCGTLTRAVLNSPKEIEAGGWIAVREANSPIAWVRMDDLTFLCPENADESKYVDALSASMLARYPDKFPSIRFSTRQTSEGVLARTRQSDEGGWQDSWYTVQGQKAIPEKLFLISEGAGIAYAVDCGQGIVFSLIAGGITAMATRFWLKRRRKVAESLHNRNAVQGP